MTKELVPKCCFGANSKQMNFLLVLYKIVILRMLQFHKVNFVKFKELLHFLCSEIRSFLLFKIIMVIGS